MIAEGATVMIRVPKRKQETGQCQIQKKLLQLRMENKSTFLSVIFLAPSCYFLFKTSISQHLESTTVLIPESVCSTSMVLHCEVFLHLYTAKYIQS